MQRIQNFKASDFETNINFNYQLYLKFESKESLKTINSKIFAILSSNDKPVIQESSSDSDSEYSMKKVKPN